MLSRKLSPLTVNGCNLVTSVINNVLGRNGSCTLRWRGVHMPFIVFLLSFLSRFLVQKIQFAAPMYFESHQISGDVHNAFRRSHVRVERSSFRSHHKPCLFCSFLSNDARFRREDLHVKVCPWCGMGLLSSFF